MRTYLTTYLLIYFSLPELELGLKILSALCISFMKYYKEFDWFIPQKFTNLISDKMADQFYQAQRIHTEELFTNSYIKHAKPTPTGSSPNNIGFHLYVYNVYCIS